jgi:hypothetical protein
MFIRPAGLKPLALVAALAGCGTGGALRDAAPGAAKVSTGVGFATVSIQPGATLNARRQMAVRAARLAALRDLAAERHGVALCATDAGATTARTAGLLRGVRTREIDAAGPDSFRVILEMPAPPHRTATGERPCTHARSDR